MPTLFSKRHFEWIVETIADMPPEHRHYVAGFFSMRLGQTNKKFDRAKFMDAASGLERQYIASINHPMNPIDKFDYPALVRSHGCGVVTLTRKTLRVVGPKESIARLAANLGTVPRGLKAL